MILCFLQQLFCFSIASMSQDASYSDGFLNEPLQCNYCVHSRKNKDVSEGVKHEPDCMNHLKFLSRPDLRRTCTPSEKYCVTAVTNLNGFFVEVERDCAESCEQGCEQHGYGLFHTECTRCCREPLCNEFDGKQFYEPLAAPRTQSFFLILILVATCVSLMVEF